MTKHNLSTVRNRIYKSLASELAGFNESGQDAGEFEAALGRISNKIAREIYFEPDGVYGNYVRHVERRLANIEELLRRDNPGDGAICRWREEGEDQAILKLIIPRGPIFSVGQIGPDGKKTGESENVAKVTLKKWLEGADDVTVIDPYLFKRSQDDSESTEVTEKLNVDYSKAILDTLGNQNFVTFIYMSNENKANKGGPKKVSKGIADYIEAHVKSRIRKCCFRAVEDLHDRVWIRRNKNGTHSAKVIGTSLDGIGKRATYLIDMPPEDWALYKDYVTYLTKNSIPDMQRPINFTKKRAALAGT